MSALDSVSNTASADAAAEPKQARVLIVEDHPMFRQMLANLVNQNTAMRVCGEADNIPQAMQLIRTMQPDLAIVDITLRGSSGLELLKDVKAHGLDLPVLVLSMHQESLYAERALRAGAKGYLTKHASADVLLAAIRRVLDGEIYLSECMTATVLKRLSGGAAAGPNAASLDALTDRELEVFQLIGSGRTTREIAERLNLGVTTVDTYRMRIKEKLGLKNATELQHRASHWVREQG
jgi:DNA-binding NarL/FixJ family response regulator